MKNTPQRIKLSFNNPDSINLLSFETSNESPMGDTIELSLRLTNASLVSGFRGVGNEQFTYSFEELTVFEPKSSGGKGNSTAIKVLESQIADLTSANESLTETNAELNKTSEEVTALNDALKETNTVLVEANATSNTTIEELQAQIAALNEQLEILTAPKPATESNEGSAESSGGEDPTKNEQEDPDGK